MQVNQVAPILAVLVLIVLGAMMVAAYLVATVLRKVGRALGLLPPKLETVWRVPRGEPRSRESSLTRYSPHSPLRPVEAWRPPGALFHAVFQSPGESLSGRPRGPAQPMEPPMPMRRDGEGLTGAASAAGSAEGSAEGRSEASPLASAGVVECGNPYCKADNPPGARFCRRCGQYIEASPPEPPPQARRHRNVI